MPVITSVILTEKRLKTDPYIVKMIKIKGKITGHAYKPDG